MINVAIYGAVEFYSFFIKDLVKSCNSYAERFNENIFSQRANCGIARKKSTNIVSTKIFKNCYQNEENERVRLALSQFPVLVKIFSHLDVGDQINCLKVCSLWRYLGESRRFIELSGMNETWQSHKMLAYMKTAIPQLNNLNRAANIHFLKKASMKVLREGAIIGICYVANKYFSNHLDNQINILNSGTLEEKTKSMIDFNNHPSNDDYIPFNNPDDYIAFEAYSNNIFKTIFKIEIGGFLLWRIASTASEIKRIWQDRFMDASQSAATELTLPLEFSEDPVLSQFVCFRSNRVMLLPVQDERRMDNDNPENGNNHVFDYLSIRNLGGPIICPFSGEVIPEQHLKFRLDIFKKVQSRLKQLAENNVNINAQIPRVYNLKANFLF